MLRPDAKRDRSTRKTISEGGVFKATANWKIVLREGLLRPRLRMLSVNDGLILMVTEGF
jgi:hypothetical protein